MKKIIALSFVLCLLLGCLTGCSGADREPVSPGLRVEPLTGEPVAPDLSGFKHYELDSGISFHAVHGLDEMEMEGNMAAYLRNAFFLVMVIEEPRHGTALEGVDLEGYAELLADSNGLRPFVTDRYGTLATTNTAMADGTDDLFFYYVTVHETEQSIWLVQIACHDDLAQSNLDDLARWSASFVFPEAE